MKLIQCPACRNQIAAEAQVCPVCGCNPTRRRVTRVLKWSIALLLCGWAAEHVISNKLAARHSASHHSGAHQHA